MEQKVKDLIQAGIRPCDLQFMTVNVIKLILDHYEIDYSNSDLKTKEDFTLHLHLHMSSLGLYKDDDQAKS